MYTRSLQKNIRLTHMLRVAFLSHTNNGLVVVVVDTTYNILCPYIKYSEENRHLIYSGLLQVRIYLSFTLFSVGVKGLDYQ